MRKILIISFLIFFSISSFAQDNSKEQIKKNSQEYIRYLATLAGSSFVCGSLHNFFIGNVYLSSFYNTVTDKAELEYTPEEKNTLFKGYQKILRTTIKEQNIDGNVIDWFGGCNNVFDEIQSLNNEKLEDEFYWNTDINLTSKNYYFGMKLKTDLQNYTEFVNKKISNLIPMSIPMVTPSYEIIPPISNSLFNKYYVYGYRDNKVSHLIERIRATYEKINLKACLEKQNVLYEYYKDNPNAKFIVNVDGLNHVTIDQFKSYSMNELLFNGNGVVIWMEFDNSDESVSMTCYIDGYNKIRKIPLYDFIFEVDLVEKNRRKTNISQGL